MSVPVYAARGPVPFLLRYVRHRLGGHAVVLTAILAAVGCAIGSQYAVKNLVDVLGWQFPPASSLWTAVGVLLALVAGDNLLWRLAGWVAARVFVELSGDLRLDLFEHLSGHAPSYFADRFPGALAGRISTAATAALTIENSLAWTTIPPAAAVVSSIAVLGLVNWHLTAALAAISVVLGLSVRHLAGRGRHLHDRYATRAAGVSGDLMDIVSNIGLVRAFGAAGRERASAPARSRRRDAALRARLSSRSASSTHACRPRRRRESRPLHLAEALSYRALTDEIRRAA